MENLEALKTGKDIWDYILKSIPNFMAVYPILDRSHHLLGQATVAYDHDLYAGVALLCRASLEASFYDALTMGYNESGRIEFYEPLTLSGKRRTIDYAEVEDAVAKRGLLKGKEEAVSRIRDDGNLTAHLAERQRKAYEKWFDEMSKIEARIKSEGGSLEDRVKAYEDLSSGVGKKYPIWISKDRALEDLRDTTSIFLRIARAIELPQSVADFYARIRK